MTTLFRTLARPRPLAERTLSLWVRRLPLWCSAALLAACSSTVTLPPWPAAGSEDPADALPTRPAPLPKKRPPSAIQPAKNALPGAPSPSAAANAGGAGVTVTPVGEHAPDHDSGDDAFLPYGPAVAARFAPPAVRYDTPGLTPGRRAYTTNTELAQWLRRLQQTASASSGATGAASATRLTVREIGLSQMDTPLLALIATRAAAADPASVEATQRPTVLLLGQQRGDEPASGEALLVLARELAPGGTLEPLLHRINVIVVPRVNPDGAQASQSASANGIDIVHDHLTLNTPEAQALATLVRDYRPIAMIDAQEYPAAGAMLQKFQALGRYDALMQYATTANVHEFVTKAAREWYYDPITEALNHQHLSSTWLYRSAHDPQDMQVSLGHSEPDTSENVNGLKNIVSLVVQSRGKDLGRGHFQRRVHTLVTALGTALRSSAERASQLEQVRAFVTKEISAQACHGQVVLQAAPASGSQDLRMIDPQSGFDRMVPITALMSQQLRPMKTRLRPCGYWLAPGASAAAGRLKLLGVQVMRVAESATALSDTGSAAPGQESATNVAIDIAAGSYYIALNQPLAHLAVVALEPQTQNSYFANRIMSQWTQSARITASPSFVFEEAD